MKALFATLLAVFVLAFGLARLGDERARHLIASPAGPVASLSQASGLSQDRKAEAEALAGSFLAYYHSRTPWRRDRYIAQVRRHLEWLRRQMDRRWQG